MFQGLQIGRKGVAGEGGFGVVFVSFDRARVCGTVFNAGVERMSLSNRVAVIGAVVGLVVYIGGDAQAGKGCQQGGMVEWPLCVSVEPGLVDR